MTTDRHVVPARDADAVAAEASPVAAYLSTLGPLSRATMLDSLNRLARLLSAGAHDAWTFAWTALGYARLQALRTTLAERYAPATANRHLSAVRGVLREAFRLGMISGDDYQRARLVGQVRGDRPPAGRALTRGEVAALFAACDPTTAGGARDAAALALLYGCGLRRGEALGVAVADVDLDRGEVRVRGKGNKHRVVPAPPGARAAVRAWLAVRGAAPGAVLVRVTTRGAWAGPARPLADRSLWAAVARVARRAGVRAFSPHDLRRTYASHLLDQGVDLALVKALMRHANLATTLRYDHRPAAAAARAAMDLHVPFGETT